MDETEQRHIALKGALNLRDLGGYATSYGRPVRWKRLYRSAELCALKPEDLPIVEQLDLQIIYDLRSNSERLGRPNRQWAALQARHLSRDYEHSNANLAELIRNAAEGSDPLRRSMIRTYRNLPFEQADSYREVLREIAGGALPLLFHCAAGKDRTGVLAAIILDVLGVARDDIIADYALTDRDIAANRARFLHYGRRDGIEDEAWEPILRADPAYLHAMFERLDEEGGTNTYLAKLGLSSGQTEAIRAELLVP